MNGEEQGIRVRYSAELYDKFTQDYIEPFDRIFIERIGREYRRQPADAALLDVGAGTAQVLLKLAAMPDLSRMRLIGLDYYQDMLGEAKRAVVEDDCADRVHLLAGDVHALPCRDGSAHLVVSRSTIHHWPDPVRAFREIDRVLAPGGVAVIHDVRRDPHPEALASFNRMRAKAGVENSVLDGKFTPGEVQAFVEEAGIADHAKIYSPEEGLASLGFELRIEKA